MKASWFLTIIYVSLRIFALFGIETALLASALRMWLKLTCQCWYIHHMCRSKQNFGDFCPNFPKLFARISPNSLFEYFIIFGMTFEKRSSCDSPHTERQFFKSNNVVCHFCMYFQVVCPEFQVFCKHFHRFCPNFHGFCPNFRQIKTFEGTLPPPASPGPYATGYTASYLNIVPFVF